ncbi:hypothetical protein LIER_17083 [Lithospermum erythrorhizon]|uniref:Uncharacterized protein n=1 Tax=Lithospermum erythrorhizon TaxID=34254 RepID=A0AAV3QD37_LITER
MSFTDRLDAVLLPQGFILPQFTQFNGSGDPVKHLQGFLAKMNITSNNPDIYMKTFSNSLSDQALDWKFCGHFVCQHLRQITAPEEYYPTDVHTTDGLHGPFYKCDGHGNAGYHNGFKLQGNHNQSPLYGCGY